jgi:hypothetical protein
MSTARARSLPDFFGAALKSKCVFIRDPASRYWNWATVIVIITILIVMLVPAFDQYPCAVRAARMHHTNLRGLTRGGDRLFDHQWSLASD